MKIINALFPSNGGVMSSIDLAGFEINPFDLNLP
jgi:hypothetical protein